MKTWKDSASLILAARHRIKNSSIPSPSIFKYDYHLLLLKRSQNSNFMPGAYVFPGGVTEPADADLKWSKLFSAFGFEKNDFNSLIPKSFNRPQIFNNRENELPREISLRITAIRETFEECGILLCKHVTSIKYPNEWTSILKVSKNESDIWQNKVHNEPKEFYNLCDKLQCYPDLWALHEWNNWLTPSSPSEKRFDTVFYLASLPFIPQAKHEKSEMDDLIWAEPKNLINYQSDFYLPPPQQYELARLAKFECLDNLLEFAVERSKIGIQMNFPIRVQLSDGIVYLLPGDSMYPKQVDLNEKAIIDKSIMTLSKYREETPIKNRFEFSDSDIKIVVEDKLKNNDGHLAPLPLQQTNHFPQYKL